MTKADIIKAAFRVWGQGLYKNTSLAPLAQDLGVTKTALYRHFKNKQALLDRMYETFFDEYSASVKPGYDLALDARDPVERLSIISGSMIRYYCENPEVFLFSLLQVYGYIGLDAVGYQLKKRGIDMSKLNDFSAGGYPSALQLTIATVNFWLAIFHRRGYIGAKLSEGEIQRVANWIQEKIFRGLGLEKDPAEGIDFSRLEELGLSRERVPQGDQGLLKAVAETLAESGPWNASMDTIARRSGRAKSSLYTHFSSKQDMLTQFFVSEGERIIDYIEGVKQASLISLEQLYLAMLGMGNYLRTRTEILTILDRMRLRRIAPDVAVSSRIIQLFSDILVRLGFTPRSAMDNAQWTLFLLINTLKRRPLEASLDQGTSERDFRSSFRSLFLVVVRGFGGGFGERNLGEARIPEWERFNFLHSTAISR